MATRFHFQRPTAIGQRRRVKEIISIIFIREGKANKSLDIIFCDNEYLLSINKAYLKHNYFTDIITFDLTGIGEKGITGEIYISTDMVKDNALYFKTEYKDELYRVIFHGVLHLCGYMDKTEKEKRVMRKKEDFYLGMFHGEHY